MNALKQFDVKFISESIKFIAGVDEVGRGPLTGPVVSAAVLFDEQIFIEGVNDSKKIKEADRIILARLIKNKAFAYGYGIVDHETIDEINILQATLQAMKIAVTNLRTTPNLVLIDGNKSFVSKILTKTIVKGDSKSFCIAAASILAKVKRDEIMRRASKKYPQYLWEKNKGYGTKEHIKAIKEFGFTDLHRKTFLRKILRDDIQEVLI